MNSKTYSMLFAYLSILLYVFLSQRQRTLMEPCRHGTSFVDYRAAKQKTVTTLSKPAIMLCYDEQRQKNVSMAAMKFTRRPYNSTKRDEFNDVYLNMYNAERMTKDGEFVFMQDHIIKYYAGSSPDMEARTRNRTNECYPYDITLTSQTSYRDNAMDDA